MKRTLLSIAMAAALFLPVATARPRPVSACGEVGWVIAGALTLGVSALLGGGICGPFGSAPAPDCPMGQVGAAGSTPSTHRYDYILTCLGVRVTGVYDVNTKRVQENLTGNDGSIRVIWKCSDDPWTYLPSQAPSCTRVSLDLT